MFWDSCAPNDGCRPCRTKRDLGRHRDRHRKRELWTEPDRQKRKKKRRRQKQRDANAHKDTETQTRTQRHTETAPATAIPTAPTKNWFRNVRGLDMFDHMVYHRGQNGYEINAKTVSVRKKLTDTNQPSLIFFLFFFLLSSSPLSLSSVWVHTSELRAQTTLKINYRLWSAFPSVHFLSACGSEHPQLQHVVLLVFSSLLSSSSLFLLSFIFEKGWNKQCCLPSKLPCACVPSKRPRLQKVRGVVNTHTRAFLNQHTGAETKKNETLPQDGTTRISSCRSHATLERVTVAPAVQTGLFESRDFDIHSTGQHSHFCQYQNTRHRNAHEGDKK